MSQPSKIAQLGILNILNQMKNPLTNIRLCVDILEKDDCNDVAKCNHIIKTSAISLENSIRDLCTSFAELGLTSHINVDKRELHLLYKD